MFRRLLFTLPCLMACCQLVYSEVTNDIRIHSLVLGYDLQYRVYRPPVSDLQEPLPVFYLTDGPAYLGPGHMPAILDRLITNQEVRPLIAVFVDPSDPDDTSNNRRNVQYLCNPEYLRFFVEELMPAIENDFPVATNREGRTVMGISFGATNAACFGLMGYEFFSGIAMQSPANHPVPGLLPAYAEKPRLPLRVFLSTGKPNDNTAANRRFHKLLREKDYAIEYREVHEGHDWDNWRPLIDDVLIYFYHRDGQ